MTHIMSMSEFSERMTESISEFLSGKLNEYRSKPSMKKYRLGEIENGRKPFYDAVFKIVKNEYTQENPIPADELRDLIEYFETFYMNSQSIVQKIAKMYMKIIKYFNIPFGFNISSRQLTPYEQLFIDFTTNHRDIDLKRLYDEC